MSQTSSPQDHPLDFSIVIPVLNEAGNITPLADAIAAAMAGERYEVIFVDDASTDTTAAEIAALREKDDRIRQLKNPYRLGQSRAMVNGIRAARGADIVTLDGDGQNPPSEIPKLIAARRVGRTGLIAGIRVKRQDTQARRLASRYANRIRQRLLNDDCPDTGCSLKLFPRKGFLDLPYFNHMHRYLPALFALYGHDCSYVPVDHRPRAIGVSKYSNWQRALVGIHDLIGVRWLQRRTTPVGAEEIG